MNDIPRQPKVAFSYFSVHSDTPCISGSVEAALRGALCGFLLASACTKLILRGPEEEALSGDSLRHRGLKKSEDILANNRWLSLLASRSQTFEAQQRTSQTLLHYRRLLLLLPTATPTQPTATAADAVSRVMESPPTVGLLAQRRLLLQQQQLLLQEEQRLYGRQQLLKQQQETLYPTLTRRFRQTLSATTTTSSSTSSNNSSTSSSSIRSTFWGEAMRQQRLLFSSRPFASLQLGRWAGLRIGSLFCEFFNFSNDSL